MPNYSSHTLAYSLLRTADPTLVRHLLRYDSDALYSHSFAEGSERFVVSLGNGWVVKCPLVNGDNDQALVEHDTYYSLPNTNLYTPRVCSTPSLLLEGYILMEEADVLPNYLYSLDDTLDPIISSYDTLTSGMGIDMLHCLHMSMGDEAYQHEELFNSLDDLLGWVEDYDVQDVHPYNFGVLNGRAVMLDLGWGFNL